ncbi:MAG TPA: ribonuclease III [Armatimonadota bacterium]|nr:ribonuclease III [Armatimonadota bacterium]HOS44235.1 ribonuclease III [Armatimonadota bacterium]
MPTDGKRIRTDRLQARLGLHFQQRELLLLALTHRSYASEAAGGESNERLEFLGDAVLGLLIGEELYRRYPAWKEGELTRARAAVVEEPALLRVAQRWHLGTFLRLSQAEETSGGRVRRALLADAVEAIIGACYLDQGLAITRDFVRREFAFLLEAPEGEAFIRDYKTRLQELYQARFQAAPTYHVISESGPPHDKTFDVVVSFHGRDIGRGAGKSKKEAAQRAAADALERAGMDEPASASRTALPLPPEAL